MSRLLSWLRLLTAIATILVIGVICWQCIDIYIDGNSPQNLDATGLHLTSVYSMENVAARLQKLAATLIGYVLLVILALILHSFSGVQQKECNAAISPENRLRLLKAHADTLSESALHEEWKRRLIKSIAALAIAACAAICLCYLLNKEHFLSWDLELVIGDLLAFILPWIIIAFIAAAAASLLCKRSTIREINDMKGSATSNKPTIPSEKGSRVNIVRWLLLILSVVCIVLGVMNGGLYDVLVKAINICTECIGLG